MSTLCHDVRNPVERSELLARKGSIIHAAELAALLEQAHAELHVALAEPDDVGEDEAASRLASALVGPGVTAGPARFGQATLTSAVRGLLRVRRDVLDGINRHTGVLVMTGLPDCVADTGTPVGIVKCAPLFLDAHVIDAIARCAGSAGPVVEVKAFQPRRIAFVAVQERLRGSALERATASLDQTLGWFGLSIGRVYRAQSTNQGVAAAYGRALDEGAELILAAGAAATDPLDVMFEALREAGGVVEQIGIPLEPGTACWFGKLEGAPVLGLAACELFGRPGALDLLLPRLLVGEALDAELVRDMALGGLLVGGPSRILPSHATDPV